MTYEELVAKRAALQAALYSGTLEVEFHSGGTRRRIAYRSTKEIQMALGLLDSEIAKIAGARVTTFLPYFSKGL